MTAQPILSFVSVALVTMGLIGNGFEMRKIRLSSQGTAGSKNVFLDKRNFKWYVLIAIGMILWGVNGLYMRSI